MTNEKIEKIRLEDIRPEVQYYKDHWIDILHTGSRVICDPPVMTTDDDWILLVSENRFEMLSDFLEQSGWRQGGSIDKESWKNQGKFRSYKKDFGKISPDLDYGDFGAAAILDDPKHYYEILNLILITDREFFEKSRNATWLAKKLNLKNKVDRILVFRAIREGLFTDLPEPEKRELIDNF
jgi:hypothetical protein